MTRKYLQPKTCNGCGYDMNNCECGRKRNTSGDVVMYSNYTDWRGQESKYAMTSH